MYIPILLCQQSQNNSRSERVWATCRRITGMSFSISIKKNTGYIVPVLLYEWFLQECLLDCKFLATIALWSLLLKLVYHLELYLRRGMCPIGHLFFFVIYLPFYNLTFCLLNVMCLWHSLHVQNSKYRFTKCSSWSFFFF